MTQHALMRLRRPQSQDPSLRLVVFQLRHQWFCLPLTQARRVVPKQPADEGMALGLTQLHNQAIPIVDTATLVYGTPLPQRPQLLPAANPNPAILPDPDQVVWPVQSILIADLPPSERSQADPSQHRLVGLTVDGTPALKRVRQSAVSPIPPMYLAIHQLRGICNVIDLTRSPDSHPHPLFWLDLETLLPRP